jgi:hypothetical protein
MIEALVEKKSSQTRLVYQAKLSFLFKGKIKHFQDKHKLKEFAMTKPALLKMLKGNLLTEEEDKHNHESTEKNIFH